MRNTLLSVRVHHWREASAVLITFALIVIVAFTGSISSTASGQQADSAPAITVSTVTVYGPDDGSFGTSLQSSLSAAAPGSSTIVVTQADPAARHTALSNASGPDRLVIAHGAGFGPTLAIVAPLFPTTAYLWIEADQDLYLSNVTSLFVDTSDGARVLGRIAGLLDDSDQVGFVADGMSGVHHVYIDQFMAGIAMTNSDMVVGKRFTAANDSLGRGHTLAGELSDAGATSLSAIGRGSRAAAVVADERGLDWYGVGIDYSTVNPNITIASLVFDFGPSISSTLTRIKDGDLGGPPLFASMRSGASRIALNPNRPLDDTTLALVNQVVEVAAGAALVQAPAQAAATPTPTSIPTPTPTPDPGVATATPTPAATTVATPTPDPNATPTPTPDPNLTPTATPTPTSNAATTQTPTPAPTTDSAAPTAEPTSEVVRQLAFTGTESTGLAEAGTALLLVGLVLASISILITRLSRES